MGNGLDALSLILRAYKELGVLAEGDEVIVPANTFIASFLAITENRLVPVPVEPDPDSFNLDPARVMVGHGASELLRIGQAVMVLGGKLEYFVDTVFNYPTLAECYKVAAFNGLNRVSKFE